MLICEQESRQIRQICPCARRSAGAERPRDANRKFAAEPRPSGWITKAVGWFDRWGALQYFRHKPIDLDDDICDLGNDIGDVYELLLCPSCNNVILRTCFWNDAYMEPPDVEYTILYPSHRKSPIGLPKSVNKAYEAALKVKSVDANAYGVLLRRLLEIVCEDRNASNGNLYTRLKDLANRGEIPPNLVGVAHGIRNLGNVGAHAGSGDLTDAEIPILEDLTRAVLEYVYSAPFLAKLAEDRLNALKKP